MRLSENTEILMTVAEWYNLEMSKIKSKYDDLRNLLIAEQNEAISDLNDQAYEKSMTCIHNWIRKSSLFYFCGDAYDGYECEKCLSLRHLNEKLHKVGHDEF